MPKVPNRNWVLTLCRYPEGKEITHRTVGRYLTVMDAMTAAKEDMHRSVKKPRAWIQEGTVCMTYLPNGGGYYAIYPRKHVE